MKNFKKSNRIITADIFPDDVRVEMDALIEQEKRKKRITHKYVIATACCLISIFVLFSVISLPNVNAERQVMQRITEIREVMQSEDLPEYIITSPEVRYVGCEVLLDFGFEKSTYTFNGGTIYLYEQEKPMIFLASESEILAEGVTQTMDHRNIEYFIDQDGCTGTFESMASGAARLYTVTAPLMDENSFRDILNSITISETK